jgi:hypothetical protein
MPASLLREIDSDAPAEKRPAPMEGQIAAALVLTALLLATYSVLALVLPFFVEFPIY